MCSSDLSPEEKREVCKNLLKDWKCDIVCLQETKVFYTDIVLFGVYGGVFLLTGLFWTRCNLWEGSC